MRKSFGTVASTSTGKPIEGAQIGLYQSDRVTPVIIYSDNGSPPTPIEGALATDVKGYWEFFAASGTYSLKQDNPGEDTKWIDGYEIYDDAAQEDGIARSIKVPAGESIGMLPAAADRANKYTGFDDAGALIVTDAVGFSQSAGDALTNRVSIAENEISALQSSNGMAYLTYETWADYEAATSAYDSGATYSKGQTLVDQDVMWAYINAVAGSGHAPPALPTVSDAYWKQFRNPLEGQVFQIPVSDTGTHVDPTNGATVPNTGIHVWTTGVSGTGAHYLYPTDAALAKPFADAAAASAVLSGHYANDDTDTDVPGGAVGERGAKFYKDETAALLATAQDFQFDAPTLAAVMQVAANNGRVTLDQAMSTYLAGMVWDFPHGRYVLAGANKSDANHFAGLTASRASTAYALTAAGKYQAFAANTLRITDRGALIEGAATNLIASVTDYSGWTKSGLTVATAAGDAPTVTATDAYNVTESTVSSVSHIVNLSVAIGSAGTKTLSAHVKRGARRYVIFSATGGGLASETGAVVDFDAAGGASIAPCTGIAVPAGYSITPLANGWYRIQIQVAATSTAALVYRLYSSTDPAYANRVYAGTIGTVAFELWWPQLEAGGVATSPCTGTRAADADTLDVTGLAASGSFVVAYEGGSATFTRASLANPNLLNMVTDGGGAWLSRYIQSWSYLPALDPTSRNPTQQVSDARRGLLSSTGMAAIEAANRARALVGLPLVSAHNSDDLTELRPTPSGCAPWLIAANGVYFADGVVYQTEASMVAGMFGTGSLGTLVLKNYVPADAPYLVNATFDDGVDGFQGALNSNVAASGGSLVITASAAPASASIPLLGKQSQAYQIALTAHVTVAPQQVVAYITAYDNLLTSGRSSNGSYTSTSPQMMTFYGAGALQMFVGLKQFTNAGSLVSYLDSVTVRPADAAPGDPHSAFSMLLEVTAPGALPGAITPIWQRDDTSERDRIRLQWETDGKVRLIVTTTNTEQLNVVLGTLAAGASAKIALTCSPSWIAAAMGGVSASADLIGASGVYFGLPGTCALRHGADSVGAGVNMITSYRYWSGTETESWCRSVTASRSATRKQVVILGDSYGVWQTGVASVIADLGYEVILYAKGGQTFSDGINRALNGYTDAGLGTMGSAVALYPDATFVIYDGDPNGHTNGQYASEAGLIDTLVAALGHKRWLYVLSGRIGSQRDPTSTTLITADPTNPGGLNQMTLDFAGYDDPTAPVIGLKQWLVAKYGAEHLWDAWDILKDYSATDPVTNPALYAAGRSDVKYGFFDRTLTIEGTHLQMKYRRIAGAGAKGLGAAIDRVSAL